MNEAKYVGLDVHQATICAAVLGSVGNLVMEVILETKTETRTGTHVPGVPAGSHQSDDTRKSDLPELGDSLDS
jgi:hypothetical protein